MSQLPHNPCHTCGACCRSYAVPVCGYDLWRISTYQRLRPQEYVVAARQKDVTPEGFRLEREGPTYFLVLDKQGKLVPNNPCIFLVRLGGNHDRCGIYTHRPVVCQVYPMTVRNQVILQREDALCPPNAWPEAMLQHPAWRAALQRQRMHFDI
jgi:Fe-S-cluster containining protein